MPDKMYSFRRVDTGEVVTARGKNVGHARSYLSKVLHVDLNTLEFQRSQDMFRDRSGRAIRRRRHLREVRHL